MKRIILTILVIVPLLAGAQTGLIRHKGGVISFQTGLISPPYILPELNLVGKYDSNNDTTFFESISNNDAYILDELVHFGDVKATSNDFWMISKPDTANKIISASNSANGIVLYNYDEYGTLTELSDTDLSIDILGVDLDENDNIIALGDNTNLDIRTYTYDSDGVLTFADNITSVDDPWTIVLDEIDNIIFVAARGGGIRSYTYDVSGNLTLGEALTIDDPLGVDVDKSRNIIVVGDRTSGIKTYTYDSSGDMTLIDSDDQGGDAWGVTIDPSNQFIFVANKTAGIESYSYDASGNLTYIENYTAASNDFAYICNSGTNIYAGNRTFGMWQVSYNSLGEMTYINDDDQGGAALGVMVLPSIKVVNRNIDIVLLANEDQGIETYTGNLIGFNESGSSNTVFDIFDKNNSWWNEFYYDATSTSSQHRFTINELNMDFINRGINQEYISRLYVQTDTNSNPFELITSLNYSVQHDIATDKKLSGLNIDFGYTIKKYTVTPNDDGSGNDYANTGIAYDRLRKRLMINVIRFSTPRENYVIVKNKDNVVLDSIDISGYMQSNQGLMHDYDNDLIYVTSTSGELFWFNMNGVYQGEQDLTSVIGATISKIDYDGANNAFWAKVNDGVNDTAYHISLSTFSVIDKIDTDLLGEGICLDPDGLHLWLTDQTSPYSKMLYKIRISDGVTVASYDNITENNEEEDITYDTEYNLIWFSADEYYHGSIDGGNRIWGLNPEHLF